MLCIADSFRKISFGELMKVYEESNRKHGTLIAPEEREDRQIYLAEQDFYSYLQEDFFRMPGAFYAIWTENGKYASALRMEPYRDGLLLEALETRLEYRGKGIACSLIQSLQSILSSDADVKIYSHVEKKNTASLKVHEKCGFHILLDYAHFIDDSVDRYSYTFIFENANSEKSKKRD